MGYFLQDDIISTIGPAAPDLFTDNGDLTKFRRNLLKIGVFYDSFNVEYVNEIIAYRVCTWIKYQTRDML